MRAYVLLDFVPFAAAGGSIYVSVCIQLDNQAVFRIGRIEIAILPFHEVRCLSREGIGSCRVITRDSRHAVDFACLFIQGDALLGLPFRNWKLRIDPITHVIGGNDALIGRLFYRLLQRARHDFRVLSQRAWCDHDRRPAVCTNDESALCLSVSA